MTDELSKPSDKADTPSTTEGISRRDFIHGVALAGVSSLLPSQSLADAVAAATQTESAYPPALTGMRGNHDGAWETAHKLARSGQRSFGPVSNAANATYDLVVVGAGVSGLAAAFFYQQRNPDARILLLDNHDDFGGHAKRNEFTIGDKTLLGYGGSQTMQEPSGYSSVVKGLLNDLEIRIDDFDVAYDDSFYRRHGLTGGVFFSEKDWGESRLVKYDLNSYSDYMKMAPSPMAVPDAVASMPMSERAQQQMLRVLTETNDCMPEVPYDEKWDYLSSISYKTFLERHLGVTEPEVFKALSNSTYEMTLGPELAPAAPALTFYALPGNRATGLPVNPEAFEPYIHHFPDGNASVARLIVNKLLPHLTDVSGPDATLSARFDYDQLDLADANVQVRLSSTVVNVQHVGSVDKAREVNVTYVRNDQAEQVKARHVILACYHSVIPALCPELPESQRTAMSSQVKTPILYTSVALNNWHAWKEMGIGAFLDPTGYHVSTQLDFPVSMGDYQFAQTPDDPIMVHMERFPYGRGEGLSKRDRLRAGRYELLSTPFETIETNIRQQLGEALAPGGFKAERDIAAITVNRWAHGYSYYYDVLEEEMYDEWDDPRYLHVQARKPYGRIAIANSDADANAMLEAAIEQGHRAVQELLAG